jgi:16S rRNA G966 N2-methylase RsmD
MANIKKIEAEAEAEHAAVQVLRDEAVSVRFRTVARAKARLQAYEEVYSNYERYIKKQAEFLADGVFSDQPFKELNVARLIAAWLLESEKFLEASGNEVENMPKNLQQGFLEKAFEDLPLEVKDSILREFNQKKQELMLWLANRIQEETRNAR